MLKLSGIRQRKAATTSSYVRPGGTSGVPTRSHVRGGTVLGARPPLRVARRVRSEEAREALERGLED